MGNIYFIRCQKYVKIGYAKDVSKRLSELQVGCPFELQIMSVIPGTPALERRFHEVLRDFHIRGEWFLCNTSSPVRKIMVLLNNGERPKTLDEIRILRDFAPLKGFGRGLRHPRIGGFNHPDKLRG